MKITLRTVQKTLNLASRPRTLEQFRHSLARAKWSLIHARRRNEDEKAKKLSQIREVLKKLVLRHGYCLDCGEPIQKRAKRCAMHASIYRHHPNTLTFAFVLLFSCLSAFAQFGVEQPFFAQLTSVATSIPQQQSGLSNWWVYTDMSTNAFTMSGGWTDRINGIIQTNLPGGVTPTNTTFGVYCEANSGLTQPYTNSVFWMNSTNATTMLIFRPANNVDFCGLFESNLQDHNDGSRARRFSGGTWRTGKVTEETTLCADFAANLDLDMILVSTNGNSITVYTNGVVTAWNNHTVAIWEIAPSFIGTINAANRGLQGYVKEVLYYRTNVNANSISNLHWYGTNTYHYSP